MDSQTLKQRVQDHPSTTTTTTAATATGGGGKRRDDKMEKAKRGLKSLGIATCIPLALVLSAIFLFGSGQAYRNLKKPFWFPPLWGLHLACIAYTVVMGLSSWLVWAEGGFHKQPNVLPLYLGQLLLSLAWEPVALGMGASWSGLLVCVGLLGALFGCYESFGAVNPIASGLVQPCLAWVAYLTLVNFWLAFL